MDISQFSSEFAAFVHLGDGDVNGTECDRGYEGDFRGIHGRIIMRKTSWTVCIYIWDEVGCGRCRCLIVYGCLEVKLCARICKLAYICEGKWSVL